MTGRLAGKVAIITGASRGLGAYVAEAYEAEGANVVIAARSTGNGTGLHIPCDVADPASIQAMAEATLDRFGRIDVLMTNAVYTRRAPSRRSRRRTGTGSSRSMSTASSTPSAPCCPL